MYIGLHVKYPLLLSDFNEAWIFSTHFRKIPTYQIWWKSSQWESSCSVRTDGQTTKLLVACRNFANAPKYGNAEVFGNDWDYKPRTASALKYPGIRTFNDLCCCSVQLVTATSLYARRSYTVTFSILLVLQVHWGDGCRWVVGAIGAAALWRQNAYIVWRNLIFGFHLVLNFLAK